MNNTFDIANFFSSKYWLSLRPEAYSPIVFKILVIFFLLMIVASVVFSKLSKNKKRPKHETKIFEKLVTFLGTIGFLSFLFVILKQYHLYFFSARFWGLIIFILAAIWLYKISKYIRVRVPEIKKENNERDEVKKYLPKSK
jgi:amino acid transporter